MILPLKISGNLLIDLKNNTSKCFEIEPIDISIYSIDKLNSIYKNYEAALRDNKSIFKFYHFESKSFLNTMDESSLNTLKLKVINPKGLINTYLGDARKSIHFENHFYQMGHKYCSIINLTSFESVNICFLNGFDFVLNLKPISKAKSIKSLDLKRRLHFSALFKDIKDIDSASSFSESEQYLESLKKDEDLFYQYEAFVYVSSNSLEGLNKKIDSTIETLKEKQIEYKVLNRDLSYHFYFNLPGVMPDFKYSKKAPISFLSSLLPLDKAKIHETGFELSTTSDERVTFNLFDSSSTNFNALITGASGEGKSMLANKILLEQIKNGTSVIILDLGNSFSRNVEYFNGVSLSESFNPFQFNSPEYLLEFVKSIIPNLSKLDCGKILNALRDDDKIDSLASLIQCLKVIIEDLEYHFEEYKTHFDSNILGNQKLLYVELSKYPDNIKGPLIIYIVEFFKSIEGKKILLMDESWQFLKNNGEFIAETFRTLRKLDGSAIAISQSLDDFVNHDLGKVVFQNCFYRFSFRQKISNPPLPDHELMYLKKAASIKDKYSEFVLSVGDEARLLRYLPDELEFILFNSSRDFSRRIEKFIRVNKEYFSFKEIAHQYQHMYFKGGNSHEGYIH